jgi:small subunit ribosomal protein S1
MENYVSNLKPGDVVNARITHLETFGAFADIGCGIVALMPIDAISVSRIEHPSERFTVGMDIKAVIKSIENGRISLSHKELLGTWLQNAEHFHIGETVQGIVRSIEPYGIFVELTPNLSGLADPRSGLMRGDHVSVHIRNMIPSRMKIKLNIIDRIIPHPKLPAFRYHLPLGHHMDRWQYSPPQCTEKHIETCFQK